MSFTKIFNLTEKRKKILVIWCCINLLALMVNFFGMDFSTTYSGTEFNGRYGGYYNSEASLSRIYWLTDCSGVSDWSGPVIENNFGSFWPFVQYTESDYTRGVGDSFVFNGIFTGYDISEFIIYIGLLLLIFYFNPVK